MNTTYSQQNNRKYYLDFLKVISLIGIIFAHVEPPGIIMMARSFDVPLMVLISAILAKHSLERSKFNTLTYFKSRIQRLVFPTWIFLVFYFITQLLFGNIYSVKHYINSFLLTRYGIGYVWIVLIYLYCALLTPFFNKVLSKKWLLPILAIVYIAYELLFYYQVGTNNKIILSTFYYIIPYGILTVIGLNYESFKKSHKIVICSLSFVGFILIAIYYFVKTGELISVSHFKYPPTFYYLAYALFCSFFLLLICEEKVNMLFKNKFIIFISSHSFWIYLWHIFYLTLYKYFCENVYNPNSWIIKFIVIFSISTLTVLLQNKIIDMCESKEKKPLLKVFRG